MNRWFAWAAVMLALALATPGGDVAKDECVVFFPGYARLDAETRSWRAEIHGWVFEPETNSVTRAVFLAALRQAMPLKADDEQGDLFKVRLRAFLVDNHRGKQLKVRVGGETKVLGDSQPNGHCVGLAFVAADPAPADPLPFALSLGPGDGRVFPGEIQLIPPEGVSVISDVDDTVKASNVLNREELLANTFVRPFKPVPGMPAKYRVWAKAGARFHYVTASPWQLYEPLQAFFDEVGLPRGTFHMKYFRVKDRTIMNLFADPEMFKEDLITVILRDFPKRRFVLVGDTGERDPWVYGEMARRCPDQIAAIYLRAVRD